MNKQNALLVATLLFSVFALRSPAHALEEGAIRVGPQVGSIILLQDVGSRSGSATGFGAFFNYGTSKELGFEIGYLRSEHTNLSHSEVNIGFSNSFKQVEFVIPRVDAGLVYISNVFAQRPVDLTSSGFGVYGGGSADFEFHPQIKPSLVLRYVKGFEQTIQTAAGERLKALQDDLLVIARVGYQFE